MRTIIRNNYTPHIGDYHDKIVHDEERNKLYLFDCDGVFTDVSKTGVEVVNEKGQSRVAAVSQKLFTDEIDSKQDTLIAGQNITIVDNVISATGGGGGTGNYNDLENLPQINSHVLIGNKTAAQLGLQPAGNYVTDANYVHTDNNFTTAEKTKLAGLSNYDDTEVKADIADLQTEDEGIKNRLDNAEEDIDDIEEVIPAQATSSNQLADKAFVNSSVQTATSNFRGNWTTYANVPTDPTLYPVDYAGVTTPSTNDYMVVQDASDYTEETLVGTWRFKYGGVWATDGKSGWNPEYQVNETPLTAAQLAALNSGATTALISQITTNENDIAGLETSKQDALTAGTNIDITNNVISADVSAQTLDNVIDGDGDITVDVNEDDDTLIIGTHAKTVVITGVPATATSGTLTEEQLAALQESENSVIKFNNEIYKLNDNGHEAGTLGYSHVGVENSVYMLKNITVTTSTRAWVLTVQEIDDFTGATSSAAGEAGLVPAPTTADTDKFLKGDGTWGEAGGGVNVVQAIGTSTTDVMSQNATSTMVYKDTGKRIIEIGYDPSCASATTSHVLIGYRPKVSLASAEYCITIHGTVNGTRGIALGAASTAGRKSCAVGDGATSSDFSVALGGNAKSNYTYSAALGSYSTTSVQGEISIGGTDLGTNGYSGTSYRKITNVYDGENAHDAATYGQLDTRLGGLTLLSLTQAEYDALTTKDANTLYVIKAA